MLIKDVDFVCFFLVLGGVSLSVYFHMLYFY